MGLADGVKGGLKIDEALEVAALLDNGGPALTANAESTLLVVNWT
jgi:hypothetical protein